MNHYHNYQETVTLLGLPESSYEEFRREITHHGSI